MLNHRQSKKLALKPVGKLVKKFINKKSQSNPTASPNVAVLEAMEPRLLLSADTALTFKELYSLEFNLKQQLAFFESYLDQVEGIQALTNHNEQAPFLNLNHEANGLSGSIGNALDYSKLFADYVKSPLGEVQINSSSGLLENSLLPSLNDVMIKQLTDGGILKPLQERFSDALNETRWDYNNDSIDETQWSSDWFRAQLESKLDSKLHAIGGDATVTVTPTMSGSTVSSLTFGFTISKAQTSKAADLDLSSLSEDGFSKLGSTSSADIAVEHQIKFDVDIKLQDIVNKVETKLESNKPIFNASTEAITSSDNIFFKNLSITSNLNVSADLTGQSLHLGLFEFKVGDGTLGENQDKEIDYAVKTQLDWSQTISNQLLANGLTEEQASHFTATFTKIIENNQTQIVDMPLSMSGSNIVAGLALGADPSISVSIDESSSGLESLTTAFTANLKELSMVSQHAVADALNGLGQRIDALFANEGLEVSLPFLEELGLADNLKLGDAFTEKVVKPLISDLPNLGLTESITQQTVDEDGKKQIVEVQSSGLTENSSSDVLSTKLTKTFRIEIALSDGTTDILTWKPGDNGEHAIESLTALVAVLNNKLNSSKLANRVSFEEHSVNEGENNYKAIKLVASNQNTSSITIKDPGILTISDMTETLAESLGLTDQLNSLSDLADQLNLRVEDNAMKIDLSLFSNYKLAETSFDTNLSFGDLAGLSSSAKFSVNADLALMTTIGFDFTPLGQDSENSINQSTKLSDLKLWDESYNGHVTEDLLITTANGEIFTLHISETDTIEELIAKVEDLSNSLSLQFDAEGQNFILTDSSAANGEPVLNTNLLSGYPELDSANGGKGSGKAEIVLHPYQAPADSEEQSQSITTKTMLSESYEASDAFTLLFQIGKAQPQYITVPSETNRSTDNLIKKINEKLATITYNASELGLKDNQLKSDSVTLSEILTVKAQGTAIKFASDITAVLAPNASGFEVNQILRSPITLSNANFSAMGINDSPLALLLGLNGYGDSQGKITGHAIHGENFGDRVFLEDTSVSALLDVNLAGNDTPIDIEGNVGIVGIKAKIDEGFISLGTLITLDDDDNGKFTVNEFREAASSGELASKVNLEFFSGRESGEFAKLTLGSIEAQAGLGLNFDNLDIGVSLELPTFENGSLVLPSPELNLPTLDGFDGLSSLSFSQMVEGLQFVMGTLDQQLSAGFYDTTLPLLNLSLKDIMDFTGDFAAKLDAVIENPNLGLNAIEVEIENMLKIPDEAFDLRYVSDHDGLGPVILLDINYELVDYTKEVALNLDLKELAKSVDNDAVRTMLEGVTNLVSAGASGQLDLALTGGLSTLMGIRLQPGATPAQLTTPLNLLNDGRGLSTNGNSGSDLKFTLKSGEVIEFDVDTVLAQDDATLETLITAINELDSTKLSAELVNGKLQFTDLTDTQQPNLGLSDIGLSTGLQTLDSNGVLKSDLAGTFDASEAFEIGLQLNDGTTYHIALEAQQNRTVTQWSEQINKELLTAFADKQDLGGNNSGKILLSQFITVDADSTQLTLSLDKTKLEKLGLTTPSLTLTEVSNTNATLLVESINNSQVAAELGLDTLSLDNEKYLSSAINLADNNERFFVEADKTKLYVNAEVKGENLNFQTNLGALEIEVKDGTAKLSGDDAQGLKANEDGFTVGGDDNKLEFKFGLKDEGDNRLYFSELENFNSNFIEVGLDGAAEAVLPVYVMGASIGDIVVNVSDIANADDNQVIDIQTPDLAAIIKDLNFLNNPEILISGLDAVFASLDKILTDSVFGFEIPIIGSALEESGNFVSKLRDAIVPALWQEVEEFKLNNPGVPPTTSTIIASVLEEQLKQLGWSGVSVTGNENLDSKSVDFTVAFEKEIFSADINLDADLGFPGLGLEINDGTVGFSATAAMEFGFGFGLENGFYIDAGADDLDRNELEIKLDVDFSDFATGPDGISASLGLLQAELRNNSQSLNETDNKATSLTGTIGVNLNAYDPNQDGIMTFDELKGQQYLLEAKATIDTVLNVLLAAKFNDALPISLPAISTNLYLDHTYERILYGEKPATPLNEVHAFELRDITLDAGQFLSGFLKPIIGYADKAIDPIRPLIDFITMPLPGVSDIVGNLSLLDIGKLAAPYDPKIQTTVKFVETVAQISALIEALNSLEGDVQLKFGTYDFGTTNPFTGGLKEHKFDLANLEGGQIDFSNPYNDLGDAGEKLKAMGGVETTNQSSSSSTSKSGLSIPLLTNPLNALKLLSGDIADVDLFLWHLPSFSFQFNHHIGASVPGIPKVGLDVGVNFFVDMGIDFAFGYDASGFVKMIESGNAKYVLDGFYIADFIDGKEKPEAWFNTRIGMNAGVDLALFKAGISGFLNGTLTADLYDPNGDGKIRAGEFYKIISETPQYLFDIDGKITAGIDAYYEVKIPWFKPWKFYMKTIAKDSWSILPETTIVDFSHGYKPQVSLADKSDNGTLTINLGDYADQRVTGDMTDGNEKFYISQSGGTVSVFAEYFGDGNTAQTFTGVNKIIVKSGAGNDHVVFDGVTADIEIDGGVGDDIFYLGGTVEDGNNIAFNKANYNSVLGKTANSASTGNVTIRGGEGNDIIIGGNGVNTVYGGNGNDLIFTGSNNDIIYGEKGDDQILSGAGNDTIHTGHGKNTVLAGTGNDDVTGGSSVDTIIGGLGADTLRGEGGNDFIIGDDGEITQNHVHSESNSGDNDKIYGGDGKDFIIAGLGDDEIHSGSGDDVVIADLGTIGLGVTNFTTAVTSINNDTLGGNDTVYAGFGQDVILGGAGNDELHGEDGVDVILGDNGYVEGPDGAQSLGQFEISTKAFSTSITSQDKIFGGDSRDILIGGAGTDDIDGGEGSDVILGDHGEVYRQTTASASFTKIVSSSSDLDNDDAINAGNGSNVVIGGGGADTITATSTGSDDQTGNNVLLGDYGQVLPAGSTIGNSPVADIQTIDSLKGGNDTITAANGRDIILGGAGDDTLTGQDGDDVILGDTGSVTRDDALYVLEAKSDKTQTLAGSEQTAPEGNDTLHAGSGNDLLIGGSGLDEINGHEGNDLIVGDYALFKAATYNEDNDTTNDRVLKSLTTTDGMKDTLYGHSGDDLIIGGAGNDVINSHEGNDIVLGDSGEIAHTSTFKDDADLERKVLDTLSFASAQSIEEELGGDDTITAGAGNDTVIAGTGDDTVDGNEGVDVILGDLGIVTPANGATPEIIARNYTHGGKDTLNGHDGNDVIIGGGNLAEASNEDTIDGGTGHDILLGDNGQVTRATEQDGWAMLAVESTEEEFGGNDIITAGTGNDTVIAGTGDDTVDGNEGVDVILGDLGIVTPANGTTPEIIARNHANGGKDTLNGHDGNDVIIGGGNLAGAGNEDTIDGGTGHDVLLGDNGQVTRVTERDDWTMLAVESTEEEFGGNDIITAGAGNDTVIAGTGDDTVHGNEGVDVILGDLGIVVPANGTTPEVIGRNHALGGKDTLNGNDGNDVVIGGGDNDVIDSGNHEDIVLGDNGQVTRSTEATGWSNLKTETTEQTFGGNDTITAGDGRDIVIGGQGQDTIYGNGGNDVLLGDLGIVVPADASNPDIISRDAEIGANDEIHGGAGHDVLIGSAGRDTLNGNEGNDVILGDSGQVTRNTNDQLRFVTTTQITIGDNDTITGGSDNDVVIAGLGDDTAYGNEGSDILIGDGGTQTHDNNWIARDMLSTDFSIGGDDRLIGNEGDDFVIGGIGSDYAEGNQGRDVLIGDQGQVTWEANGHRKLAQTLVESRSVSTQKGFSDDELWGGIGDDNLLGGRLEDKLYGGLGSDILIGDEGNIIYKNDKEFIAQSKESFSGRADVMHLGTSAGNPEGVDLSPDFLLGGEQPNFNYADTNLDMILHENAHVEISPDRIAEWEEPPFLGDPISTTTDDFFATPGELDNLLSETNSNSEREISEVNVVTSGTEKKDKSQSLQANQRQGLVNTAESRSPQLTAIESTLESTAESQFSQILGTSETVSSELEANSASPQVEPTNAGLRNSSVDGTSPSKQTDSGSQTIEASNEPVNQEQPDNTQSNDSEELLPDQVNHLYFDTTLGIWVMGSQNSAPVINNTSVNNAIRIV